MNPQPELRSPRNNVVVNDRDEGKKGKIFDLDEEPIMLFPEGEVISPITYHVLVTPS